MMTGVGASYLQASQAKNINSVNVNFLEKIIKQELKSDPTFNTADSQCEKIYNLVFTL